MDILIPGTDTLHTQGPTATKVDRLRPEPPDEVLGLLRSLVQRSRRSAGVPLVESFVRRNGESGAAPPLVLLLRGGQGGEVRLKLYLTIALLAVRSPFVITDPVPARSWAAALGLDDPEHKGARRIGGAISWLAEHRFLDTGRRQGTPGSVQLLSQDLSGSAYQRPGPDTRYIQLPLGLWDEGWIVRLSGTALAILIVLLDLQGGRAQPQWISPAEARRRYDLSPDTWTKGLKELKELDLVTVTRRTQGDVFDYKRMRNAYWVRAEKLRNPEYAPPRPTFRPRHDSAEDRG
jgi:hypothetical protein